jgi:peptidoglycan hydrolase CwlO-like protein
MKMRGIRNIFLYSLAVLLVSVSCGDLTLAATLDELNSQKSQLSQDITNLQNAAENKEKEAQSLSKQISNIENDIKSTESKIESTGQSLGQTQTEIDALSGKIDTRKKELELLKKKLNASLVEIYRSSMKSEYELILGATSLSQSSNEKNYLQAVEGQVKILHTKVNEAKTALETQKSDQEKKKAELEELKRQQEAYRQSVAYQKTTKDKLLNMTVAQQEQYVKDAKAKMQQVAVISAAIRSALQASARGSSNIRSGGSGGYPYYDAEPFSMNTCMGSIYTFCKRNCTDYVAWRWSFEGFPADRLEGAGDARKWAGYAVGRGLRTGYTPSPGAAIVWNLGTYGHVAYVESVNSDGTFNISEYNFSPVFQGKYSTDTISTTSRASMGTPQFIYPN